MGYLPPWRILQNQIPFLSPFSLRAKRTYFAPQDKDHSELYILKQRAESGIISGKLHSQTNKKSIYMMYEVNHLKFFAGFS